MAENADVPAFIQKNWEQQKCLAFNATDALFSAYMSAKELTEPGGGLWWWFAADAIEASAALFSCSAPPRSVYEEEFDGDGVRCQCAEVAGQLFLDYLDAAGNRVTLTNSEIAEAKQIKNAAVSDGVASCNWVTVDQVNKISTYQIGEGSKPIWYIVPTLNTGCCKGSPIVPKVQPYPPAKTVPKNEESCGGTWELLDSCVDRYGLSQNFYRVDEFYGEENEYGAACRYKSTYFYWETIRGPFLYPPFAEFEGLRSTPKYAPPHPHKREDNGGPGGAGVSDLSAVTYTAHVGCSWDPEEGEYTQKYEYNVEYNSDGILGLARRLDAIADLMNKIQLIPYVDCATTKPKLEGQWVSTHWVSDGISDGGSKHLRKLFRYRTKSDRTTDELQQHWKQLVWEAGPVLVGHKGAWWGTPQVWALNEEEGKRILRFAGREAGLDPDLDGEWFVGSSSSPRYGMKGRMRLARKKGDYWVTSRDSSNGLPELSLDP